MSGMISSLFNDLHIVRIQFVWVLMLFGMVANGQVGTTDRVEVLADLEMATTAWEQIEDPFDQALSGMALAAALEMSGDQEAETWWQRSRAIMGQQSNEDQAFLQYDIAMLAARLGDRAAFDAAVEANRPMSQRISAVIWGAHEMVLHGHHDLAAMQIEPLQAMVEPYANHLRHGSDVSSICFLLVLLGEPEAARAATEPFEMPTRRAEALSQLAYGLIFAGEDEAAEPYLQEALALMESVPESTTDPYEDDNHSGWSWGVLGFAFALMGDAEQTEAMIEAADGLMASSIRIELVDAYARRGDIQSSQTLMDRVISDMIEEGEIDVTYAGISIGRNGLDPTAARALASTDPVSQLSLETGIAFGLHQAEVLAQAD